MNQHGLVWNQIQTYDCDADGSFAQVNCKEGEHRCGCVDKANNWIESYNDADILKDLFNCRCVRDKLVDDNIGLACDKRGNYQPIQTIGNEFCVDLDGFQYTPPYPPLGDESKKCIIANCKARQDECINSDLTDNGQCQSCTNIYDGACN